jgi:alkylhydroperoxidase family enzyme
MQRAGPSDGARVVLVPAMARIGYQPPKSGMPEWNISRVLANSDPGREGMSAFLQGMRKNGALSNRQIEIGILRTASVTQAPYEYGRHVIMARDAGLDDATIRAIRDGRLDELDDADRVVAEYAGALNEVKVTDELWARATEYLSDQQMLELSLWTAFYGGLARIMHAVQIDLDEDIAEGLDMPS